MNFQVGYIPIIVTLIVVYVVAAIFIRSKNRGPKRSFDHVDLTGKIAVVTGSSAGIGKETARALAKHGCTVVFAARNKSKTEQVIEQIAQQTQNKNLHYIHLDLSKYETIYTFSEEFHKRFNRLDILVNNAGVAHTETILNDRGHDEIFATNSLGHFLLTDLLIDIIIRTNQSRIINITSQAYSLLTKTPDYEKALRGTYQRSFSQKYAASKFANIVFTLALQDKLDKLGAKCKCVSVHPGVVRSEIWTKSVKQWYYFVIVQILITVFAPYTLTEEEGAWSQISACLMPWDELEASGYYTRNRPKRLTKLVKQEEQRPLLWEFCEKTLGIKTKI